MDPGLLSPPDVLQLERSAGNRAVAELLARPTPTEVAAAGNTEQEQNREEPRTRAIQVMAVLEKGSSQFSTYTGSAAARPGTAAAEEKVNPTAAPTIIKAGRSRCTPHSPTLDWDVAASGDNWRANVKALKLSGSIEIEDWPSAPTSMTVPNTPNPVDGGNINNVAGSKNRWQFAIDDMANYDKPDPIGKAGPYWHSTAASTAHEMAHWEEDWLNDSITANWEQTNIDIDLITVPMQTHPDPASAGPELQTFVDRRFETFSSDVAEHWSGLEKKDRPGQGGQGYAAGMKVLDGHIAAVKAYASAKGWT